ncbi:hypothetical protein CU037_2569 [Enterococcus faecium]|nr:hypothetical protein [Enterococcus faecium]
MMKQLVGKANFNNELFEIDLEDNKIQKNNFWDRFLKNELFSYPSTEAIDLMYLSEFVYFCDRNFMRELNNDGWKRDISLSIPVLNIKKFEDKKDIIQDLLNFLSGDTWNLSFFKRKETDNEKRYRSKCADRDQNYISNVCMFSGGLDSFIGAIDLLEKEEKQIFVSHYGGSKGTLKYQDLLREQLMGKYPSLNENDFFQFYIAPQIQHKDRNEDTTRSRSLLFFSHAISIATSVGANKLIIPENGFISLNVPLTPARIGSSSTRTTHPYYFLLFENLLEGLGINIEIYNPFKYLTKGQMIKNCKNRNFLEKNIVNTMSCSKPDHARWNGYNEPIHCGYCIPCTIRRASILEGKFIDKTEYFVTNYSTNESKSNLNAFRLAIANNMEKDPLFTIQSNGPILNNFEEYGKIYLNGLIELKNFLERLKL